MSIATASTVLLEMMQTLASSSAVHRFGMNAPVVPSYRTEIGLSGAGNYPPALSRGFFEGAQAALLRDIAIRRAIALSSAP